LDKITTRRDGNDDGFGTVVLNPALEATIPQSTRDKVANITSEITANRMIIPFGPPIVAIVLAFGGLALALNPRSGDLNLGGMGLAFAGALGFAIVITVSSRVFRASDARPFTFYMTAVASIALSTLCLARGECVLPLTGMGWLGFVSSAVLFAFAIIAFFIAVSMIGPVTVSLLSYAEPVITAGLGVTVLSQTLTLMQSAGIALVIFALVGKTVRPFGRLAED
jgi:drug/metabolite transporter (DMT)-like permease